MPFNNIFNEWYAAQTSKKIRASKNQTARKKENGVVPCFWNYSIKNFLMWLSLSVLFFFFEKISMPKRAYSKMLSKRELIDITVFSNLTSTLSLYVAIGLSLKRFPKETGFFTDSRIQSIAENTYTTRCIKKTNTVVLPSV